MGFLLALAVPAAGQEVLYAGTGDGPVRGALGTLNQTTGDFTFLGDPTSSSRENLVGLSFNAAGRLFGVTVVNGGGSGSALIEIDPSNGSFISKIGNIVDQSDEDVKIVDLATQPSTDMLFGIDSETPTNLWTIDQGTAKATKIGNTGLARGGLAFGPDGTLYLATAANPGLLARLDPATGAPIGTPIEMDDCIDGLAVRPSDGALFGAVCDDDDTNVRINAATGKFTALPTVPDYDVADMAFTGTAQLGVQAPTLSPAVMLVLAACLVVFGIARLQRHRPLIR
jgi:hypothetical protein